MNVKWLSKYAEKINDGRSEATAAASVAVVMMAKGKRIH